MPCVSASLTAAFHSGAGIGDRFVRVARQRLIRAPISVTSAAISGRFFARMSHPPRRAWMAPRYVRRYARVTHPCRRDTNLDEWVVFGPETGSRDLASQWTKIEVL